MISSCPRAFAPLPVLVLAFLCSPLAAADAPVSNLVKKFTEKRAAEAAAPAAAQPLAQTVAQPVAAPARLGPEATMPGARKPSPPLASLPAPKAASESLHILLVDDDASPNNGRQIAAPDPGSDTIYRELVAGAVRGDAAAWSAEVVGVRANGPTFERLRNFNVVVWYTGAAIGANNDTVGREDEKLLRRYLEEVGGSVIIISPGYVNNLVYGQTWEAADHPFLKEVLAVNGSYGMAQRFAAGEVRAFSGATFRVAHPGAAETQFSVVNPDGAALVFTSPIETSYARTEGRGGLPVAVANSFGGGRIVYAGFTFENIPEAERTQAFSVLLAAAGAPAPVAATGVVQPVGQTQPAAVAAPAGTSQPDASKQAGRGVTASSSSAATGVSPTNVETLRVLDPIRPRIAPEIPGAPPAGLVASPVSVGVQRVQWTAVSGAKYAVLRQEGQNWTSVATDVTGGQVEDRAMVAAGTVYRVTVRHADGKTGQADTKLANPMQPSLPTRMEASQIAANTVRLSIWSSRDGGLEGYQVYVSTAPNAGKFASARPGDYIAVDLVGVPVGAALLRVVPRYTGKLTAIEAQQNVTVAPWSGRYRVLLIGFRAELPTKDEDIFGGDGAGDEVFFGAYRALIPPGAGNGRSLGVVRSVVFGDNSRLPGRVRAGSATPTGGIRSGDVVPSDAQVLARPGGAALPDRLPMLLWEGRLDRGGDQLALGLVGFEWDNAAETTWDKWQAWWTSPSGAKLVADTTRDRTGHVAGTIINPKFFSGTATVDFPSAPGSNRPLSVRNGFPPTIPWKHYPQGIVLSQENLEATLQGRAAITIGVSWRTDAPTVPTTIESTYVAYLQLERLGD